MNTKKKALGRGLDALLSNNNETEEQIVVENNDSEKISKPLSSININFIESNPFQPRTYFDEDALNELADSIRAQGIIQPIAVRKLEENRYQLISGERRLKASKIAGLTEIPAYVRSANDLEMLEMALVENIQRENLNAIEVAIGYQQLIEECKLTQEEISVKVGKNRSTITNYLRLLKLPQQIQDGIISGKISMAHARSLITVDDEIKQIKIFKDIVENDLSVRKVEEIVRNLANNKDDEPAKQFKLPIEPNPQLDQIKEKLVRTFNTSIEIKQNNKGKGNIVIQFKSNEELERILSLIER